jgi:hypothetical protein
MDVQAKEWSTTMRSDHYSTEAVQRTRHSVVVIRICMVEDVESRYDETPLRRPPVLSGKGRNTGVGKLLATPTLRQKSICLLFAQFRPTYGFIFWSCWHKLGNDTSCHSVFAQSDTSRDSARSLTPPKMGRTSTPRKKKQKEDPNEDAYTGSSPPSTGSVGRISTPRKAKQIQNYYKDAPPVTGFATPAGSNTKNPAPVKPRQTTTLKYRAREGLATVGDTSKISPPQKAKQQQNLQKHDAANDDTQVPAQRVDENSTLHDEKLSQDLHGGDYISVEILSAPRRSEKKSEPLQLKQKSDATTKGELSAPARQGPETFTSEDLSQKGEQSSQSGSSAAKKAQATTRTLSLAPTPKPAKRKKGLSDNVLPAGRISALPGGRNQTGKAEGRFYVSHSDPLPQMTTGSPVSRYTPSRKYSFRDQRIRRS